jgi:hypothetical protein
MSEITITVARADGEVTRLEGESGLAACTHNLETLESPVVSLRCSDAAELAWNLAALMASVRSVCPEAFQTALVLMDKFDPAKPEFERWLPQRQAGPR